VRRAKVSRAAFYAHFEGKEECFLAATREGGRLMVDEVIVATRALPGTAEPEEALRAAVRALLAFLAAEPEFTRVFYVEMAAAGARSLDRIDAARFRFANLNRAWLQRARARYQSWPPVPDEFCLAAVGATTELIRAAVHRGEVRSLPDLEDLLVGVHLSLLGGTSRPGR
ncbi:MAG: TetR/AcrR family transcriptional regulator, partial [Streptosporangiaceae bacterium]